MYMSDPAVGSEQKNLSNYSGFFIFNRGYKYSQAAKRHHTFRMMAIRAGVCSVNQFFSNVSIGVMKDDLRCHVLGKVRFKSFLTMDKSNIFASLTKDCVS
jgi:hypothetical protein